MKWTLLSPNIVWNSNLSFKMISNLFVADDPLKVCSLLEPINNANWPVLLFETGYALEHQIHFFVYFGYNYPTEIGQRNGACIQLMRSVPLCLKDTLARRRHKRYYSVPLCMEDTLPTTKRHRRYSMHLSLINTFACSIDTKFRPNCSETSFHLPMKCASVQSGGV